ncbi:tyrosine-type recombinase/integrase [Rhodopirellula europaea]|uniref:Protein containing Integrase, catalytic core, phage domain protein n=1 Tax=Rhodopirellula europaea 6C TaxID=1263867 RepID=M2AX74_9BACT|nr:protein containing Integrase, catalytic core, phage domain protein [Rhodopirellula europaea 6C]
MASVLKRPNGHHWVQFWDLGKKRQTIRLGKSSRKKADRIKSVVEDLLSGLKLSQAPDDKTLQWLDEADDDIYVKLAAVGLVDERSSTRLAAFVDNYIESRSDLKPRTVIKFNATRDYMVAHFGEGCDMRKVTEADGQAFRVYLLSQQNSKGQNMAENTVRKHTQIAKQFFNHAVSRKLLRVNPLAGLPSTVMPNKERMHYITHDDARAVIDACPDSQWRLIFALARYGALRCPSEILELKWSDIDWDKQEMLVRSEKTAHHVGQGSRRVPIFTDLMPFIEDAQELSEGTGEYLIHRYRDQESNLRTQLHRIIKRARLSPWPKAFQNLRASRATDLVTHHPLHVVSQWTGHSIETMKKFYLQVTDEHREAALAIKPQLPPETSKTLYAPPEGEAKPKPKPSMRDTARNEASETGQKPFFTGFGFESLKMPTPSIAAEGLEPPTRGL